MLPQPATKRFQPLRSGLINLFKYQEQEFWYERGRLLIRGNNGSGKSRVLALQLPFLLDGEISPRRVEPDGDPARQIAWHLLMDEHHERTGYTWIEFGRKDDDGCERYLTLGCGMRAIRGGDNQPARWFFVTEKRIGSDFKLVERAQPLSSDRLVEVVGQNCFFKVARDYRAEIDRRLFSLGKERYEALIELLIRLRAPQLSKKLEERTLFAALTDALPPLSAKVVEHVATAFKQLDELREQYSALQSLSQSLAGFQSGYQAYLRVALMRRAEKVRQSQLKYEEAQRRVTEIERTIKAGEDEKDIAHRQIAECKDACTAAETRFEVLQQSSTAADAQRLDDALRAAESAVLIRDQAQTRVRLAKTQLETVENEIAEGAGLVDVFAAHLNAAMMETKTLSKAAGFMADHVKIFPEAAAWKADPAYLPTLKEAHKRLAGDHLHRLDQIQAGLAALATAEQNLKSAQSAEDQIYAKVGALSEAMLRHGTAAETAVNTLSNSYSGWHHQLQTLDMPPWSELAPAFADWLETDDETHRLLGSMVEQSLQRQITAIATARADVKAKRDSINHERQKLLGEREALRYAPPPPEAPRTRNQSARTDRAGAALWQVCEFHPNLSQAQQAGLEAALEASGLLDAWITPEGNLLGDLPSDTFLDTKPADAAFYPMELTLANWLIFDPQVSAEISSIITKEVLQRALSHISAIPSEGGHWVTLDGRWQLGPVFGRGEKAQAEYLGMSSREMARQRRLAEVERLLTLLEPQEADLNLHDQELINREQSAQSERDAAPGDVEIARNLILRTNARLQWNETSEEHSNAVRLTFRFRAEKQEVMENLKRDARDLGYGEHVDQLANLSSAWNPYILAVEKLWGRSQEWGAGVREQEKLEGRQRICKETLTLESEQANAAQTSVVSSAETFKTLQEKLGATISDYQSSMRDARSSRDQAASALEESRQAMLKIDLQLAALSASLPAAQVAVSEAGEIRDQAIQGLRVPLHHGLYPETDPGLADIETDTWSPSRANVIARRILKDLPETNLGDEAWTRRLNNLENQIHDLRTQTGSACEIESQVLSEGLTMVVCRYQGLKLKPAECLAAVVSERETHERLLDAGERDIIDRHLITEVSMRLQDLIENAQLRTKQMNEEMTRCATTLGVTLRLGWEPLTDGLPSGISYVRKLLLVDHATWSAEERTVVGNFLHQLIQNERAENPQLTAAEQLLRALDYRQWHMYFAERHQNGRWERLTKKRYGTGSGGEKALMLTIPQMAAASSHYQSAAPHAPRFILLDEAFAGMDPPTRAKLMGLLEAFDLDLLMTSEREWGTHATVKGIAIYQLVADAVAVAATRWIWNGHVRFLAPVADSPEFR